MIQIKVLLPKGSAADGIEMPHCVHGRAIEIFTPLPPLACNAALSMFLGQVVALVLHEVVLELRGFCSATRLKYFGEYTSSPGEFRPRSVQSVLHVLPRSRSRLYRINF